MPTPTPTPNTGISELKQSSNTEQSAEVNSIVEKKCKDCPLLSMKSSGLTISKNGIEHLKKYESFESEIYKDKAGYDTIGYGHKIIKGEDFSKGIKKEDAEKLLHKDIMEQTRGVKTVKRPLNQAQFDALTSFVYNEGPENFRSSTLYSRLNNTEDLSSIDDIIKEEFPKWNKSKGKVTSGLINRRNAEIAYATNNSCSCNALTPTPTPSTTPTTTPVKSFMPTSNSDILGSVKNIVADKASEITRDQVVDIIKKQAMDYVQNKAIEFAKEQVLKAISKSSKKKNHA